MGQEADRLALRPVTYSEPLRGTVKSKTEQLRRYLAVTLTILLIMGDIILITF